MTNEIVTFSYDGLSPKVRATVRDKTSEIKTLLRKTAQDIFDLGAALSDVRAALPSKGAGNYQTWLENEVGISRETADNFVRVFEQFKSVNFMDLDVAPSALYLLAAPSTPVKAREDVLKRASAGEKITHKIALEVVSNYKKFGVLLVIPHWEDDLEDDSDYPVMTPEELAGLPLADLAADNCALYLYASAKYLFKAHHVAAAWGFEYTGSAFTWARLSKDFPAGGEGILNDESNWHDGPDNGITISNSQIFFLFRKGKPKRQNADVRQLIVASAREDTSRPDELFEGIERMFTGPYLDVFPRAKRAGWANGSEIKSISQTLF